MPVITLPADQRWGQLGQGLGGLIGQIVSGVQERQAVQGVAQVIQDPQVPQENKFSEILKRFGDRGVQVYTQMMKADLLREQIHEATAKEKQAGAATAKEQAQTKQIEAGLPFAQQIAQAKAAAAGLEPAKISAETYRAEQGGRASAAEIPLRSDEAALARQRTATEAERTRLEAAKPAEVPVAPGAYDAAAVLKGLGIPDPTPAQVGIAQNLYSNSKTVRVGNLAVTKFAQDQLKKGEGTKDTPEPIRKVAASSDVAATSMERFVTSFQKNPGELGFFKGATAKGLLEKYGISTGDVDLLNEMDAQMLAVSDQATRGGGFFAAGRVKLAKDVTPGISESPLRAIIAADQVADRHLSELRSYLSGMTDQEIKKPVEAAIDHWERVKSITGSLQSWPVMSGGRPTDKTAMVFGGDAVDPSSFRKRMEGRKTYVAGDGRDYTGGQLIARAMQLQEDPVSYARSIGVELK
jgi:hypothetical protein